MYRTVWGPGTAPGSARENTCTREAANQECLHNQLKSTHVCSQRQPNCRRVTNLLASAFSRSGSYRMLCCRENTRLGPDRLGPARTSYACPARGADHLKGELRLAGGLTSAVGRVRGPHTTSSSGANAACSATGSESGCWACWRC